MAAVELKKYSGLSLVYDSGELRGAESGVEIGSSTKVLIDDMRRQLLNPDLSCPDHFYSYFQPVDRKSLLRNKKLILCLFVIPQNLAGIEYVKTKGMCSNEYPLLLEVVQGYVTALLQRGDPGSDHKGVRSVVAKLKKGEKLVIPPHTSFVLVNGRQTLSVVAMIRSLKAQVCEDLDDSRGAASYIIRKNARQEVVQNPYYRRVLRSKLLDPSEQYRFFGLTEKTPIFKQILRKYERFTWLHDPSKVKWDKVPVLSKL